MNIYRSGDQNQRKPVLKPLSAGPRKRPDNSSPPSAPIGTSNAPKLNQPIQKLEYSGPAQKPVDRVSDAEQPPGRSLLSQIPNFPTDRITQLTRRTVQVPVWLAALLAIVLITAPIISIMMMRDTSDDVVEPVEIASEPEPTEIPESAEDLLLALDADVFVDSTSWSRPELPSVSNREQYLLDGGVYPDLEVRYAADEVARLQAELEAIQRNSALLRGLARQQSGDLTAAYSTLELTQEQADDVLEDLQGRIDDLEGRIQSVDELARELRDILGLPPSSNAMGGPTSYSADEDADPWLVLRADIVSIEHWAGELVFDLDEINTEIQLRMAMVDQTGLPRGTSLGEDLEFFDSMPMGWPVEGPVTSRFGVRSSPFSAEGSPEMHTGIDIAARTGTPVIATGGGTVQIAGDNGGYGLLVVIDHGRGVTSWYGHNSRMLVSSGQRVNAGDVIAEVGSTGRSTGPHVHYEVRVNGVPEDPLPYMQMDR